MTGSISSSEYSVRPPARARLLFALGVAGFAAILCALDHIDFVGPSDFGPVWFGARSLLKGTNPYPLVGPGLPFNFDFRLNYPATAMLLAMPLAMFTEKVASVLFAAISAGLLAYGITRDGWDRAWIFFAPGFIVAARIAQWTPLVCATVFIPQFAFMLSAKPNLGLAVVASTGKTTTVRAAVIGALVLGAISLILMPTWPLEWWRIVRAAPEFNTPVTRAGGFLVLAGLLRWKQPEARWLLAVACVPQVASWYETMLPLLVARTKREMQALVFVSFLGYVMQIVLLSPDNEIARTTVGDLIVISGYLPALVVVLTRPNVGDFPAMLRLRRRRSAAVSDPSALSR